jgi:hypothetical protein
MKKGENTMKLRVITLLLAAGCSFLFAQEPAPQPKSAEAANEERLKDEQIRVKEMQVRLQELQSRLLSEKSVHEEQAKLAKEYARQALELQKSWSESPERQADLARAQFELQKELSMAGLYKERMMDFADPEQMERQKQIMALEAKCMELSSVYKENKDPAAQKKIEQDLGASVNQLFDLRETQRQKDISRMENDLAQMKKKLEDRLARKDQICKKRLEQLLGKSEDLEW